MYHYRDRDNTPRIWGGVAALLYLVVMVCALLFVSFRFSHPPIVEHEGILINFGVSHTGSGNEDVASTDLPRPTEERQSVKEVEQEPLIDEKSEVAIPTPTQESQEVQQRPREVNKRALFPGRTPASQSINQGVSPKEEMGNAGDISGTPDGVEYTLTGRSIVGELPKPEYQENSVGKVIIDVVVDQSGRVTGATYRAQGSTTNNSALISAARTAALKARFSEGANFVQGGSITYIFKME